MINLMWLMASLCLTILATIMIIGLRSIWQEELPTRQFPLEFLFNLAKKQKTDESEDD